MTRIRRLRPTPALVVAIIALFVALTSTGYAAFNLPRNSVSSIHVKDRSLLAKDFRRGQIPAGPQGPQGLQGPQGPAGQAGPAGPPGTANIRWAVFRPDGGVTAQSGGISLAAKPTSGQYLINFGSAVAGKLIVVSSAFDEDIAARGGVTAGPCGNPPEGLTCSVANTTSHVLVHTRSSAGALEDHSFYVAVFG
jgi:hypothetical protein